MSVFTELFGDVDLQGQGGAKVKASTLESKQVVGLYFSAHWCPPCRAFTPKLAETYKKLGGGSKFEVVFISSDRDQASFDGYFAEHPWLALPFESKNVNQKISQKFGITGYPTLLLLDSKGNVFNKNGRRCISEDPEGEAFPWTPLTFEQAIGTEFVKGDSTITAASLAGKTVGLYFSAHWCGPCRGFTPKLAETYKKAVSDGKPFEIIFVSWDKDQASFDEYRAEMPWAALPFSKKKQNKALSERFEVSGIPSLVILDGIDTARIINDAARSAVSEDPEANNFPWHPASMCDLANGADGINGNPSLIAMVDGIEEPAKNSSVQAIREVSERHYAEARAAGQVHADIRFFSALNDTDSIPGRIRELTKTSGPTLVLLDIPDNGGFYTTPINGALTTETIDTFLDNYKNKSLERKQMN